MWSLIFWIVIWLISGTLLLILLDSVSGITLSLIIIVFIVVTGYNLSPKERIENFSANIVGIEENQSFTLGVGKLNSYEYYFYQIEDYLGNKNTLGTKQSSTTIIIDDQIKAIEYTEKIKSKFLSFLFFGNWTVNTYTELHLPADYIMKPYNLELN